MAMRRPNSKRNLDMAIRRLGANDGDYSRCERGKIPSNKTAEKPRRLQGLSAVKAVPC